MSLPARLNKGKPMAVFYMRHSKHGTKVACQEEEREFDLKHGWKDFDPNEFVAEVAKEPARETLTAKKSEQVTAKI